MVQGGQWWCRGWGCGAGGGGGPSDEQHQAVIEVGHYGLQAEVEQLKRDKNVLMQEVIRLRQQQQVRCWSLLLPCRRCPALLLCTHALLAPAPRPTLTASAC